MGGNNQIASMLDTLKFLTLETYNLWFIASKLLTVADMMAIWFTQPARLEQLTKWRHVYYRTLVVFDNLE